MNTLLKEKEKIETNETCKKLIDLDSEINVAVNNKKTNQNTSLIDDLNPFELDKFCYADSMLLNPSKPVNQAFNQTEKSSITILNPTEVNKKIDTYQSIINEFDPIANNSSVSSRISYFNQMRQMDSKDFLSNAQPKQTYAAKPNYHVSLPTQSSKLYSPVCIKLFII